MDCSKGDPHWLSKDSGELTCAEPCVITDTVNIDSVLMRTRATNHPPPPTPPYCLSWLHGPVHNPEVH